MALHSVANDYFAEKQAEQDIYMAMSAMKGDTHETVSSPQTPYFPDAEAAIDVIVADSELGEPPAKNRRKKVQDACSSGRA